MIRAFIADPVNSAFTVVKFFIVVRFDSAPETVHLTSEEIRDRHGPVLLDAYATHIVPARWY